MAFQEAPAPTPQAVVDNFVNIYYAVLASKPEIAHEFYLDMSTVTRPNSGQPVSSFKGISEMILAQDYKNSYFEISTVDAQLSIGGRIVAMVTGFFARKDDVKRRFTQLFVLAPQDEKTYFVLNDVFQYMDVGKKATAPVNTVTSNTAQEPINVSRDSVSDMNNHSLVIGGSCTVSKEVALNQKLGATLNGTLPTSKAPVSVAPSTATSKMTYAQVANSMNSNDKPFVQKVSQAKPVEASRPPVVVKASPNPQIQSTASANPQTRRKVSPPCPQSDGTNQNTGDSPVAVKGHSIFVGNLPMDATVEQLAETFKQYGAIQHNGIQVRSYPSERKCFGFVHFKSADALKALEGATIMIGNRKAFFQEKNGNVGNRNASRGSDFYHNNSSKASSYNGRGHGAAGRNGKRAEILTRTVIELADRKYQAVNLKVPSQTENRKV